MPAYNLVYRELFKEAGIVRICDSDNPFVRLTEHKKDENSYYIFAINYNKKQETAQISISEDYRITKTLYGKSIKDNTLNLRENDGAIFMVERIVI